MFSVCSVCPAHGDDGRVRHVHPGLHRQSQDEHLPGGARGQWAYNHNIST